MTIQIPADVAWILEKMREAGYEAYAVGGCVRDALLGKEPNDWDITTSAKPEETKTIFPKTIDTGIQHGTVTVMKNHVGYEITTYRIDGTYADGRHPDSVEFTSDLKEDLRRRDFTINAMAYSEETGVVDEFGGMEDLDRHVIRCVGNAMERFTEDALRILRAVRFSAQLGFEIEEETYKALSVIAPNLRHVSAERIQVELTKTLLSAHPERVMLVEKTGMTPFISKTFRRVFEEESNFTGTGHGGNTAVSGKSVVRSLYARLERAAALPQEKAVRWAALLAELEDKTAVQILREMKLDNDTIRSVKTLVGHFTDRFDWDTDSVSQAEHKNMAESKEREYLARKFMSEISPELLDRLFLLIHTLDPDREKMVDDAAALVDKIRKRGDCVSLKTMAVTGQDLIRNGIKPGPELGRILAEMFEKVLRDPAENEKEKLLRMLDGETAE
ncbi:MAG: CCA tRNA nucleotidyltransferase [[Clostridium] aminophilum]|uniref:CCA tRNA nucleotidyltransferase n=1 Tax=[Clostridium] aminophilum TaxID=1526 RepID=UPI0026EBC46A|nr:CCA tRNA nucleotidyltransferase [[Clostridium] aminophilum]MDD6195693.1 CCA tRNA nucleotidyltransferase [[Clostridium] aminophilum]